MFARRPLPTLFAASAELGTVLVAGCGDDDARVRAAPADGTFVGRVESSVAYIALVATAKRSRATSVTASRSLSGSPSPTSKTGGPSWSPAGVSLLARSASRRTGSRAR